MKRILCCMFAALMVFSMLILPTLAMAQGQADEECNDMHGHIHLAVGTEIRPMAECNHDWPYSTIYRPTQIGFYIQQRYYKVCSNCGEEYSWYTNGASVANHKGPYSYITNGTDSNGNPLYLKKCNACGEYV